jgi:DNA-binding NarL/FixJ family response regulator
MIASQDRLKRRVFLVDDHPLAREWLTVLINREPDMTVCGDTGNADWAFRSIEASRPDVAVVEISLNRSSGIGLIENLSQFHPEIAILVFTVHNESLYANRALRAGARGYITKRENTGRVIEAIRRVATGGRFAGESRLAALAARQLDAPVSADSAVEQLSYRELQVFEMLGQGFGTRHIAESLSVSVKTVETYLARTKEKLNLGNATALFREAFLWNETRCTRETA